MKAIRILMVWLGVMSISVMVYGQNPGWSVDYSQYQFRMSVSALLEVEGVILAQGENKVAALVGDEVRGLGYANLFHAPSGLYLAIFQIGSNLPTGEEVTFFVYRADEDLVVAARKKINFKADQLLGSIGSPYFISDDRHPTEVNVSSTAFEENTGIGQVIAEISVKDEDDDTHDFVLSDFDPVEAASLIKIDQSNIVVAQLADFENLNYFTVVLTATDPLGAAVSSEFSFTITDQLQEANDNKAPTLEDTTFQVMENTEEGTVIGMLVAHDQNATQNLTYEIMDDDGVFSFSGSELLVQRSDLLDYEENALFTIQVMVSDDGSPVLSDIATVYIELQDVIEKELSIRNYISPNGDGINDFLTIENVEMYDSFELKILNTRGSLLYHQTNYDNTWGGYYRGERLPTGVYYYVFESSESRLRYEGKFYIKDR